MQSRKTVLQLKLHVNQFLNHIGQHLKIIMNIDTHDFDLGWPNVIYEKINIF